MRIQLEQIDLLQPWPQIALRPGYHAVRVLVYVGTAPLGEVTARPARRGVVTHRGLRKRIARKHSLTLLRMLAREGLSAGPDALKAFDPDAKSNYLLSWSKWRQSAQWVERNLLLLHEHRFADRPQVLEVHRVVRGLDAESRVAGHRLAHGRVLAAAFRLK